MNSVILIGRLTRDPEIRYTAGSQMAIAKFSIAVDRPVRAGKEREADFPRITVFGKQAENCERFLAKGRLVGIQGRLQTGSYQDRDGKTVYTPSFDGPLSETIGIENNAKLKALLHSVTTPSTYQNIRYSSSSSGRFSRSRTRSTPLLSYTGP